MMQTEYSEEEDTPCRRHRCDAPCCEDYEVKLLGSDVEMLENAGHQKETFIEYEDNFIYLRKQELGCMFLDEGVCTVHTNRPLACRTYPWIREEEGIHADEFCPYHGEFELTEEIGDNLKRLIYLQEEERRGRNICFAHGCDACCRDTEMPLTNGDLTRISDLGYDDCYVLEGGELVLRNVDHRCFFLEDNKRCRIYENRPEGCRFYPFVMGREGAVLDVDCPNSYKFRERFGQWIEDGLIELVGRLDSERTER